MELLLLKRSLGKSRESERSELAPMASARSAQPSREAASKWGGRGASLARAVFNLLCIGKKYLSLKVPFRRNIQACIQPYVHLPPGF